MRPDVTQNPTGYKLGATNLNVAPIPLNLAQFTTIPLNPQQNDSQQQNRNKYYSSRTTVNSRSSNTYTYIYMFENMSLEIC